MFERLVKGHGSELVSYANQRLKVGVYPNDRAFTDAKAADIKRLLDFGAVVPKIIDYVQRTYAMLAFNICKMSDVNSFYCSIINSFRKEREGERHSQLSAESEVGGLGGPIRRGTGLTNFAADGGRRPGKVQHNHRQRDWVLAVYFCADFAHAQGLPDLPRLFVYWFYLLYK
ncbi:hypothetical protein PoB_003456800 [Plakobranchus ocellatus]|uniref:Uncharacterized protein n=1 Tax=Plakobranchus ocellatus TaxID=259542 RepID=A0AAV4AL90_9GAST|nr:hypothetical protein PoB_003456800 [Plakobranchus ocellatus]